MARRSLLILFALLLFPMLLAHAQSPDPAKPDSTVAVPAQDTASVPSPTRVSETVPAPTHITPGARIFIEPSEFGMALAAAILKKNVRVVSMTDSAKSDFFVQTASNERIEKGGERIAKALVFGGWMGSGRHFSATVTITNRDGAIVFAHNSKKENFQDAAQNIASKLKQHIERPPQNSK